MPHLICPIFVLFPPLWLSVPTLISLSFVLCALVHVPPSYFVGLLHVILHASNGGRECWNSSQRNVQPVGGSRGLLLESKVIRSNIQNKFNGSPRDLSLNRRWPLYSEVTNVINRVSCIYPLGTVNWMTVNPADIQIFHAWLKWRLK